MLYEDEFDDEYDAEEEEYDDTTVTMACDDCDYRPLLEFVQMYHS